MRAGAQKALDDALAPANNELELDVLRSAIDGARQVGVSRKTIDSSEARLLQVVNIFAVSVWLVSPHRLH